MRDIGWNQIQLAIPHSWEASVQGTNQLLLEEQLHPIAQIRWEKPAYSKPEKSLIKLKKKLAADFIEQPAPPAFQTLQDHYLISTFSYHNRREQGALLICKTCGTALLYHFFNRFDSLKKEIATVLQSVQCHHNNDISLWAIQDFQINIPEAFNLHTYAIKSGLTSLTLTLGSCNLYICRLAQAARRLEQDSLSDILSTLTDCTVLTADLSEANSIIWSRSPSIPGQIAIRLKRKKPFIRARLWHLPQEDRILAVLLEDKKPIPADSLHQICNSYEIISANR